jgi:integrase
VSKQFRHPTEKGLREKNGKWEYRFDLRGRSYSQVTDFEAVAENINAAQAERAAHIRELKAGKNVFRRISVPLDKAVSEFNRWYRSEHPRGGNCAWATSLMSSFQFYFEAHKTALEMIGPKELEEFKLWRRENKIHANTLRKQLIHLTQFFSYARKCRWIAHDPFALKSDDPVKIPPETDSTAMHVLSIVEEEAYLASAANCDQDLADVATIMVEQGPRPDEILSLRQADIDLFNRNFTIWGSAAEGKTENAHRTLRMTDIVHRIFARRLKTSGLWVFPSTKNKGHRTTLQKSHERVTRGKKGKDGECTGGCGVKCRIYDFRHTFATRFALAGGSLPVLAMILGHSDLSLLMRYVHPSQADMDRAMEWYASQSSTKNWPGPEFGPSDSPKLAQTGPIRPKRSA